MPLRKIKKDNKNVLQGAELQDLDLWTATACGPTSAKIDDLLGPHDALESVYSGGQTHQQYLVVRRGNAKSLYKQ
jgi:hypothetical protein